MKNYAPFSGKETLDRYFTTYLVLKNWNSDTGENDEIRTKSKAQLHKTFGIHYRRI